MNTEKPLKKTSYYRLKPYINNGEFRYKLQEKFTYYFFFDVWKNTGKTYSITELDIIEKEVKHLSSYINL